MGNWKGGRSPYGMKPYSHTRLEEYDLCPRRYSLKRIKKVPEPAGDPLVIGSLFHAFAAMYDEHLVEMCLQTNLTVVESIIGAALAEPVKEGKEFSHVSEYAMSEASAIMRRWAEAHILSDPKSVYSIEEMKNHEVTKGIAFWYVCDRVDIVDGAVEIIDYKTDWIIRPRSEIESSPQGRTYAWCLWQDPKIKKMGIEKFRFRMDFVRHGYVSEPVEYTLDDLRKHQNTILSQIRRIESDTAFKPTPGAACAYCGYRESCPALTEASTGPVVIATREQAEKAYQEWLLYEAQANARRDALKRWCTEHGHVEGSGTRLGFHTSESVELADMAAFDEAVTDFDINPDEFKTVSATALKKLMKKPEIAKALEPALRRTMSTTFKSVKTKGEEVAG